MKDPFYISAIWNNKRLTWYWSEKGWIVQRKIRGSIVSKILEPLGMGNTKDEAFLDWKQQVEGN